MSEFSLNNVVNFIEKNRISSVEVADALNKTGVIPDIKIFNSGHFIAGQVSYIYAFNNSNWSIHQQIETIKEDTIVYVDGINCKDKALFGDLISKYLMLYKKSKGIVVNGSIRDAHRLKKENYSIWCKDVTPLGCFNIEMSIDEELEKEINSRKSFFENSILVCDDSGCTIIESKLINKNLIKSLEYIELQEDIWYFCLDTLKMSTFEIVCLKKYLKDPKMLPENLREKLSEINKYIKV